MNRCPTFACGFPEGECYGTCHRVNASFIECGKVVAIKGRVEQRTEHRAEPAPHISRARLALNTFRLYSRAGCGVQESARNALRAYRQRS